MTALRFTRVRRLRSQSALSAALMCWALSPTWASGAELKVWIHAFIPKSHPGNPGYIIAVPGSPGAWMIPAPSLGPLDKVMQILSSVPLDKSTCFATDNRGFDPSVTASARLSTAFKLAVDGTRSVAPLNNNSVNWPGLSIAYKCSDGSVILKRPGKMQVDAVGTPAIAGSQTQLVIQAAASLPFVTGSAWIDYSGDFIFDNATHKLTYRFTIGNFPAFEAYAQLDNGPIKKLFAAEPKGADVWSLLDLGLGAGSRNENGDVQF